MTALHARSFPGDDARALTIWRELEARARPSYFLTSGWIETWLAALPAHLRPELVALFGDARPVAAFFVGTRRVARHGFVSSRARFLNTTGERRYDDLCAEHNQVLHDPATPISLGDLVAAAAGGWDELFLPAIDVGASGIQLDGLPHELVLRIDRREPSPFVDLESVRRARLDYPALLHANTRTQVRRAERAFGRIDVDEAETVDDGLAIFDELVSLHQARWRAKNEPGAFADAWFTSFHRDLVRARLPHGEIQLLRVRSGRTTIGCVYSLVANGRVLFYQSGLASFRDPHQKAGYVCHAAAIRRSAEAGHAVYDFLGGDARYKSSLATGRTELVWARVQRPRVRFAVEERLRGWARAVRERAAGRAAAAR